MSIESDSVTAPIYILESADAGFLELLKSQDGRIASLAYIAQRLMFEDMSDNQTRALATVVRAVKHIDEILKVHQDTERLDRIESELLKLRKSRALMGSGVIRSSQTENVTFGGSAKAH